MQRTALYLTFQAEDLAMRSETPAQLEDVSDSRLRRRQYERVPFNGQVRLMLETHAGLVTLAGNIIDISLGGCAVRVYQPVQAHCAGRVQLELGKQGIWLPIVTRWARRDPRGWTIGMEFDRPTEEKLSAVARLIDHRTR